MDSNKLNSAVKSTNEYETPGMLRKRGIITLLGEPCAGIYERYDEDGHSKYEETGGYEYVIGRDCWWHSPHNLTTS